MNNMFFIIIILGIIVYVFFDIKNKKITVKESFWWSFVLVVALILSIFPYSIDIMASWLGIAYAPTMLLTLCSVFLLLINYKNSKKIGDLNTKVTELEQEIAISKVKNGNKKDN